MGTGHLSTPPLFYLDSGVHILDMGLTDLPTRPMDLVLS